MRVALISKDSKKELMVQFCIAYCGILAKKNIQLCSTNVTGILIEEATGLQIEKVMSGKQGGLEQICARIAYDEIDVVIYFRDGNEEFEREKLLLEAQIVNECDKRNIPLATNIATAETLIRALDSGELDWREYINPTSNYNKKNKR